MISTHILLTRPCTFVFADSESIKLGLALWSEPPTGVQVGENTERVHRGRLEPRTANTALSGPNLAIASFLELVLEVAAAILGFDASDVHSFGRPSRFGTGIYRN